MSDATDLPSWIDRNSVRTVRVQTVTLDGALVGKHLSPRKFESGTQSGWGFADIALAVDLGNTAQLGFDFGDWRGEMHDVFLRPDLATLSEDASLPGLATVMCDLVDQQGAPLPVCSRSTLARMVGELGQMGYTGKAAVEIEATVFEESIEQAREQRFKNLHPLGGTQGAIYLLSRSRDYTILMDAMADRIERAGIPWEGWADESAHGQIEINLPPTDILTAADWYVRTKQIMREVAYEHGRTITFMARWSPDQFGQGAHINLSLQQEGRNAFFDPVEPQRPSETMRHFIGGVLNNLAAASSFQYPTVNSYRRIAEFDGPPTTVTWGVDNKSAAVRAVCTTEKLSRVEYRVPSADVNIYLSIASFLAGGLIGLRDRSDPGPECTVMAWGLPPGTPKLPATLSQAIAELSADRELTEVLGREMVEYWIGTRRWEWLQFFTTGGDPAAGVSDWELERYFEHV
ncbi:glutamine synthetase family protein [Rhodococcus sp. G-MC3]|uniref:glutamine synthetase family protein n=1 Tax=Rhodococcus sp. G-MC3 TaxID=3046209 RepID=UPI0024B8A3D1|nr:glutamine synthetase family protein [Rhodococcus sp. G-MC3]MDJ0392397.1 glutamine synthetase family protein [Rhodococcus sp. G-MC3]